MLIPGDSRTELTEHVASTGTDVLVCLCCSPSITGDFRGKSGAISLGSCLAGGRTLVLLNAYVHPGVQAKGMNEVSLRNCLELILQMYGDMKISVHIPEEVQNKKAVFACIHSVFGETDVYIR